MYNTDLPNRYELPTSKQLLRSTLFAAAIAALLLVTTVLPAEYGIDPTGAGRYLGLTSMGEIKASLAEEQSQEAAGQKQPDPNQDATANSEPPVTPAVSQSSPAAVMVEPVAEPAAQPTAQPVSSDQKVVTLKPGEATEIKLGMNKGATVTYQWTTQGGAVNYDTHGDAPGLDYYGYGKGRQVQGDSGVLQAAFDGKHGWFWRNRSANSVTITLTTTGEYLSIQRMM